MTFEDDCRDEDGRKFYELVHPGGPKGVLLREPKPIKQDAEARPAEFYAVVFFPRIDALGPAHVNVYGLRDTLSQTPEAAVARFMDKIAPSEKWDTYFKAGHRIRRVEVRDLGDADHQFVDDPVLGPPSPWPFGGDE